MGARCLAVSVDIVKPKQVSSQPQCQESLVPILIKNGVIDVGH